MCCGVKSTVSEHPAPATCYLWDLGLRFCLSVPHCFPLFPHTIFFVCFIFRALLLCSQKNGKGTDISHLAPPSPQAPPPPLLTSPPDVMLVTTHEPTLTRHHHPESTVYPGFILGLYIPQVEQMFNHMCPPLWYPTEEFHCPKHPCDVPIHPFPTNPWKPLIF